MCIRDSYKSKSLDVEIDGINGRDQCVTELEDIVLEPERPEVCTVTPKFISHAEGVEYILEPFLHLDLPLKHSNLLPRNADLQSSVFDYGTCAQCEWHFCL